MNYEIITFNHEQISIDVKVDKENNTVWLSTEEIGILYGRTRQNIFHHIKTIYDENAYVDVNA